MIRGEWNNSHAYVTLSIPHDANGDVPRERCLIRLPAAATLNGYKTFGTKIECKGTTC